MSAHRDKANSRMILIALGANLPAGEFGAPLDTLKEALRRLDARGARVVARSSWYDSPAWPDPSDPPFTNAVAALETRLDPVELLALLHAVEAELGRRRDRPNQPRTCDLDLLAYGSEIRPVAGPPPHLPHPRLPDRDFVLLPLAELVPRWRHPVSGLTPAAMLATLGPTACRKIVG